MADICDITQERFEKEEALRRRFVPKNEIEPKGFCYYCEEEIPFPKKFCDASCVEDWEFEKKLRSKGK